MACTVLIIVILLQCLLTSCNEVLRFQLTKQEEVSAINDLAATLSMDFWQFPNVAGPTDVYIDASRKTALVEKLQQLGVRYDVIIPDVAKLVEEERRSNSPARRRRKRSVERQKRNDSVIGYYVRHDKVMNWMDKLSETVPIANVFSIGKSYEGRDLRVLKLSTGTKRSAIFFSAGLHSGDWLAVAATNYFIEKIIKGYKENDREVMNVLSKMDLYILPIANPDGYEFTFSNETFLLVWTNAPNMSEGTIQEAQMWSKNRQPYFSSFAKRLCKGVNLNVNFDLQFGGPESNPNPCHYMYNGPNAFSEPETAAIRDFMLSMRSKLKAYIDVHCCSKVWGVPWYYTMDKWPRDYDELMRVAKLARKRIKAINNNQYIFLPWPTYYDPTGGTAVDWAKGVVGVKYSYLIHLWSNQSTMHENVFTPEILLTGEELYAGSMAVASEIEAIPS